MTSRVSGLRAAVVSLGVATALVASGFAEESLDRPKIVRIGLVGTLFRDIPEPMARALMQPFGALMQSQTGVSGELLQVRSAENLGKQLAGGQIEIGVFHGFEFAWARTRYPGLRPLMIAVNQQSHLRADLVVGRERGITSLADLEGKTIALPHGTREHCRLFLDRRCEASGRAVEKFFGRTTQPASIEDALDDVVDGVVQATVVDGVSLDAYKRRKPGRFARLQILQESEVFPAAVVAYQPGTLNEETLQRFRAGLLNAQQTALGRQLLVLWNLTAFETVPEDYERILATITKAYPPPGVRK
jgi:ABC-type phosphate/phosphonate transport system substrate-binding protein